MAGSYPAPPALIPPRFRPFFGGPAGFQNVVIPCIPTTVGGIISLAAPSDIEWFGSYYDQTVFGAVADETPTGLIFANVENIGVVPVYSGTSQADGAIVAGDFFQLAYDSSLGADGGFHLLNWSRLGTGGSAIDLTTDGVSGPATLTGDVLNIPVYSSTGNVVVVTAGGPVNVRAGDGTILLNKGAPSATPINLPAVASRDGLPLQIADFAGNGGDVTITAAAGETIMGLSTAVLASGGQGIGTAAAITLYPSTDLSGWYAA